MSASERNSRFEPVRPSSSCYGSEKGNDAEPFASTAAPITAYTGFKLIFDYPEKLHAPGDIITGRIEGWDVESGAHVHIILEGRAKSYLTVDDKVDYKDRAPLLYKVTHLRPTDVDMVPRFAIAIPEVAQSGLARINALVARNMPDHYWTHEWTPLDPYEHEYGHDLPPSMIMPRRVVHTTWHKGVGKGYVEYKLTAIRSRASSKGGFKTEASFQVPIWLTTCRLPPSKVRSVMQEQHRANEELSVQTSRLLTERKLKIGERFRDTFSSSSPSFHFAASIATPNVTIPGADFPIMITIAILPPPAGKLYNFPIPSINVENLTFRLRSYQGLRVKGALFTANHSFTFKYDEIRKTKDLEGAAFKPKDGNYDKQSCVVTYTVPKTILPSFKTYNMWRAYRVKCQVEFSCAGKEIVASSKSDLNIVARPATGGEDLEAGKELREHHFEQVEEATSLEMAETMVNMANLGVDAANLITSIAGLAAA